MVSEAKIKMIRNQEIEPKHTLPTGEEYAQGIEEQIDSSLENAARVGFSLDQSLKVAHTYLDDDAVGELKVRIKGEMGHIAGELGIHAEYYNSAANTIALAAVAQTSLENTARRDDGTISQDRWELGQAELYDAILVFAGKDS